MTGDDEDGGWGQSSDKKTGDSDTTLTSGEDGGSVSVLCRWHDRDIGKNNVIIGVFETHEHAVSHILENYDVEKVSVNTFEDTSTDYQCHYYIQLWNVAGKQDDELGCVRGRREVEEKIEELEEDTSKLEEQLEVANGGMREMVLAKVLNEYQMGLDALYWVLGEVDDL